VTKEERNVRTLGLGDLARCVELSKEAGWNQNEGDWRILIEHGHGYGIALPGKGLVATTGAWPMGENFAWINMVLVTEECRRQGLAGQMLNQCLMDTQSRGQIPLLDATDQGAKVYEKMGFAGEQRFIRLKREREVARNQRLESLEPGWSVRHMEESDLPEVRQLDQQVLGADRSALVRAFWKRCAMSAWVLRDKNRILRGFLLGRGGRTARQLGPMVVERVGQARTLMARALEEVKGPVYIDVPEIHLSWMGELTQEGFLPERRFRRMGLNGTELSTDWNRYYAIAGPDFA